MNLDHNFGLLILVCGFLLSGIHGRTDDSLRITLSHGGKIVGRYVTTHDGKGVRAFLGVPYAEPPVGPLRFKAPVPKAGWNGEIETIADPHKCTQRDPYRRDVEIEGSEDCLYINVYTPTVDRLKNETTPLAVMVWYHGGGFICGSGIKEFYGPDFLLEHNVIFVSVNYRVGPLGFLSTGQEDCPGNNGLKDQAMVLKWVQENIAAFGGDPNRVTIFGESAGGATVTYLMMSPLSKGLFSRAIAQSGTNLDPWAMPAHEGVAPKRAAILAEKFDCYSEANWKKTIDCLRSVPAEDLTAVLYEYFEWDTDPMVPFPPVIEPDLPGAYITKHPRDIIEPHGISVPFMTGLTSDEGAMKAAPIINLPELYNDFILNRDKALPIAANYDHHAPDVQEHITKQINRFYFNDEALSPNTHQNLTNLFTDSWFLSGMDEYLRIRLLKAQTEKTRPTYVYLFSHKGAASLTEIFHGGRENHYGTSHAEDLQYLFPLGQELFVSAIPTEEDYKVRKILTELWVNFANTGEPTPASSSLPKWSPTQSFPLDFYKIGNGEPSRERIVNMDRGIMDERAKFWREINPFSKARHTFKDEL